MQLLLKKLCPNDYNDITSIRLENGLVCETCLPDKDLRLVNKENLIEYLNEKSKLTGDLLEFVKQEKVINEFSDFAKKLVGEPLSAQRNWLIKAISEKSFAITYPTGLGKTTFGILYILYNIQKDRNKRYMFITPTKALVQQTKEKFENFASTLKLEINLVSSNDKNRRILKEKLINKNYTLAILTPAFLSKNRELFTYVDQLGIIDLVFVDDVDALLKRSKNIDYILHLIGFDKELLIKIKGYIGKIQRRDVDFSEKKDIINLIQKYKSEHKVGQLIFSSATTRVTSSRIKLLKLLLNFEPGSTTEVFRKIYDIKVESKNIIRSLTKIIKLVGSGGIIFLPSEQFNIGLESIKKRLERIGIKSAIVTSKNYSAINEFKEGKVDVLIGYSRFYSPLVRGLDIPDRIKYAIFCGIPRFYFNFKSVEKNPIRALWIAGIILNAISDHDKRIELLKLTNKLRMEVQKYTPEQLRFITHTSQSREDIKLFQLTKNVFDEIQKVLYDEKILNTLKQRFKINIEERNGEKYFIFADSLTYLQGSGRTSRMYFGGITTVLSFLIVDDEGAFNSLTNQLRNIIEEFDWTDFKKFLKNKDLIIQVINKEREAIIKKEIKHVRNEFQSLKTALFVVESPTKARSIASFFGRPSIRYLDGIPVYECVADKYILNIIATKGHLLDLVYTHDENNKIYFGVKEAQKEFIPIYTTIKRCLNCHNQFTEYLKEEGKCNFCGSTLINDSINVINVLKQLSRENDMVIIATDPDTEGEKIAYDVYLVIKPFAKEIKRAEMHEITLKALNKALNNLREINKNFVTAQVIRRIGDRWVGFSISYVLQKLHDKKSLGLGRVQAPTLRWIIESYRSHIRSNKRYLAMNVENENIKLHITSEIIKLPSWNRDKTLLIKKLLKNKEVEVEKVSVEESYINSPKPFTTTEMLTEGVNKLKISSDRIMRLAQDLFEAGLITYHRTDSYYISEVGFQIAYNYLKENNMEDLYRKKQYGEQGTHECIRPTRPLDRFQLENSIASGSIRIPIQLTVQHFLLYDLIFRNFIASQMKSAKIKRIRIMFKNILLKINNEEVSIILKPLSQIIYCDKESFAKILPINVQEKLKEIKEGDKLKIINLEVKKKMKMLLTEDSLIKRMKKEKIGRPSTYAITIQKLREHKYIFPSKIKKMLIPSKLGMEIVDYLKKHFKWLVDVKLTRDFENVMDEIEKGKPEKADTILDEFKKKYYVQIVNYVKIEKPTMAEVY